MHTEGPSGPTEVLREVAERALHSQGFQPKEFTDSPLGQWWLAPWDGPKCFLQWSKDRRYVDEENLRNILTDYARYRPLNEPDKH